MIVIPDGANSHGTNSNTFNKVSQWSTSSLTPLLSIRNFQDATVSTCLLYGHSQLKSVSTSWDKKISVPIMTTISITNYFFNP